MMLRSLRRMMPAAVAVGRALRQPVQRRTLWEITRSSDLRSLARDMERQADRLERDIAEGYPFIGQRPRSIPISQTSSSPNTYRYNVDVEGFKPEEIKVSLKDHVLTISATMSRVSEDGSKFYHEIVRQITIPKKVNIEKLKCYVKDGVVTVEAPIESNSRPEEVAVSREEPES